MNNALKNMVGFTTGAVVAGGVSFQFGALAGGADAISVGGPVVSLIVASFAGVRICTSCRPNPRTLLAGAFVGLVGGAASGYLTARPEMVEKISGAVSLTLQKMSVPGVLAAQAAQEPVRTTPYVSMEKKDTPPPARPAQVQQPSGTSYYAYGPAPYSCVPTPPFGALHCSPVVLLPAPPPTARREGFAPR